MTFAPEQAAWDIIWEVEDTDPGLSMSHARTIGGIGSSPTPGDYLGWLEEEAARQKELAQLYPEEALRHTHRHTLLTAIADRLHDLGMEPVEVRDAPSLNLHLYRP